MFSPEGTKAAGCPTPPVAFPERRRHPRIENDENCAPTRAGKRPSLLRRVFDRLGLRSVDRAEPRSPEAGHASTRLGHLAVIAQRLEAILADLDQLEAWREAADVCSAIERLKARIEAGGSGTTFAERPLGVEAART